MFILDTHVWIWLINGDEKIRKAGFLTSINNALKNHSIIIPAICTWEISMLVAKNRISLTENTLEWINKASSAPGISIFPLSPEVAYESTILPGEFHGDPADRMIVATARITNGTLLTFDKQIINYAKKGYVKLQTPKVIP
ncbi:MAG TPA: type II toxin-antitoxin system VapC family toxin [Spirochaetota bacterium]|nr:type II toxin-antitoxin system VapC family toxin [Spirochaetota bacterium]